MPEPTLIAVPAELLAGMAESMRDAATLARETRGELVSLRATLADHITREEPALKAHEEHIRAMLAEDAQATAEARTVAKRAETAKAQQRAELRSLIVRIVIALGGLALGAGGMAAIGGSP